MATIYYSTTLQATSCGNCGIPFGLPTNFMQDRRKTGETFFCPNGHRIGWGDYENKRLRRELNEERRRLANAREDARAARAAREVERRKHSATKGVLTKTKKRIEAGVCIHCQRTFQNVARHMKSQHPEEGLTRHA